MPPSVEPDTAAEDASTITSTVTGAIGITDIEEAKTPNVSPTQSVKDKSDDEDGYNGDDDLIFQKSTTASVNDTENGKPVGEKPNNGDPGEEKSTEKSDGVEPSDSKQDGAPHVNTPKITVTMDGADDTLDAKADSFSSTDSEDVLYMKSSRDKTTTKAVEASAAKSAGDNSTGKTADKFFTNGSVPRALTPDNTNAESSKKPFVISLHKDSDLYIHAKNKDGIDIVFEVNSFVLAAASPVFRKMIYGPSHRRPDTGDWIIHLEADNAKALRHVFRIIHFQYQNRDAMRMRTAKEIGQILQIVHKYEMDAIIYPFAKKWSADLVHDLAVDDESTRIGNEQSLWIAWKLGDFAMFRDMMHEVVFWATVDQNGALRGPHEEPIRDLPWPKDLLEAIQSNRLTLIRRILSTLSDPIDHIMSAHRAPDGRYCLSTEHQADCQAQLLGTAIIALTKAEMWPLPKPEEYSDSVYRLRQIVGGLHISALLFPGRPPHEQRHMRCGLGHKEVLNELMSFVPVLPDSLLEDIKRRGQMMSTFSKKAWAPYLPQDKWDDIDMNPEDSMVDDAWNE